MRQWIVLIVFVLITVGYAWQTGLMKRLMPAPPPVVVVPPLVDPATVATIKAFLAKSTLSATLAGPPDIAVINAKQTVSGGRLLAAPGIELEVREVGDGFVVFGYKDQTFRIERATAPGTAPAR